MFKTIELAATCKIVSDTVLDCKVFNIQLYTDKFVKFMTKCKGNEPKWFQKFENAFENVHDGSRSGRPSVVSENLVFAVHAKSKKIHNYKMFT